MNSHELIATYGQYYVLDDPDFLEVVWAAYTGNSMPGEPLWLMAVGPPSGGRSTAIRLLKSLRHTFVVDGLTEHTLVTGLEGATSLLNRLDGKVMVIEDGGFLQSLPADKRNRIFAQLRKAYDGDWSFAFGTKSGSVTGKGKFGVIMACTPAIDNDAILHSELGERFLKIRPKDEHRVQKALKAIQNIGQEKAIFDTLSKATRQFLGSKWNPVRVPLVDQVLLGELASVTDMVTKARTPVQRGGRGWHIVRPPQPESPARMTKQLTLLAESITKNRGLQRVTDDEMAIVRRVASDCIPVERLRVLDAVHSSPSCTLLDIAEDAMLPRNTVRYIAEDLVALGLLDDSPRSTSSDEHEFAVPSTVDTPLVSILKNTVAVPSVVGLNQLER